jgi:hypothetical protein
MPSCNAALLIAVKLKTKEIILTPSKLLFHILKQHLHHFQDPLICIISGLKIDGITDNPPLDSARSL